MRRAFDRSGIGIRFSDALKHPAISICLRNTARAAIVKRMQRRRDAETA